MPDRATRLSSFLQDRAAHYTVVIVLGALAGLSAVTNRKRRCGS